MPLRISIFANSSPSCRPLLLACLLVAFDITGLYSFSPTPNVLAALYALLEFNNNLIDFAAAPAGKKKDIEYGNSFATSVAQNLGSASCDQPTFFISSGINT